MLFLIGMMGAGKSTIGNLLSLKIGLPFIDLDDEIAKVEGRSINHIFNFKGEKYFRVLENKVLNKVKNSVCACGGGVVTNNENIHFIKKKGTSILLRAKIEELSERLDNSKNRPVLKNKNVKEELKKVWDKGRDKYLRSADLIVQTDNKSPKLIVSEIELLLQL